MTTPNKRTAIVTGSSGGIGTAVCQALRNDGFWVAGLDVAPSHDGDGPDQHFDVDVTDEASVRDAIGKVVAQRGTIDGLATVAGITGPFKRSHEIEVEEFDRLIAVNVKGTWLVAKHVITHMLSEGTHGSIVYISSINGLVGGKAIPMYHATKGAVRLLAKADAVTYGPAGIRVNSVHPGSIQHTPMTDAAASNSPFSLEEYERRMIEAHPLGRRGEPSEIADAVAFLLSDRSTFITGTEVVVDGGYTAR